MGEGGGEGGRGWWLWGGCSSSTECHKTMTMQYLVDARTYEKRDLNIDMRINKNFKKLLHKYNVSQNLNKNMSLKSFKTSNFYGLPEIH